MWRNHRRSSRERWVGTCYHQICSSKISVSGSIQMSKWPLSLKGLLAAHRGGYMESSQREKGPVPLLWRASDFLKWAELCPSGPELGHALMWLVITGHVMTHACEVELLILAHHFYQTFTCLDGVDILVALGQHELNHMLQKGIFHAYLSCW